MARPVVSRADLAGRLDFETLISDVSARLVTTSDEGFDTVIEEALGRVVRFFGADRGGILVIGTDRRTLHLIHAWYDETLKDRVPLNVDLAERFPYACRLVVERRQPYIVHSYDDVPADAAVDRASHVAMGVRSTLNIPIAVSEDLQYVMNIDAMRREIRWPPSYVPRLQLLGAILANAVERRRIGDALRQSEARLALATISAGAGAWDLDMSTGRIWATPAAKELYGLAHDVDVTFDMFLGLVHPDDAGRVRDRVMRALASASELADEYRVVLPGGAIRWIAVTGRVLQEGDAPARRVMGISLDVTARKAAEAENRLSLARLEAAVDVASLGFYELVDRGIATFLDPRCRALLGVPGHYTDADPIPEFWGDHVHPDDRAGVLAIHEQLNDGRLDIGSAEYRYLHPERGATWLQHVVHVVTRHTNRQAHRTIGVVRDITARKNAEESLAAEHAEVLRLREQLERENTYLRQEVTGRKARRRIVGSSAPVLRMLEEVSKVAPTNATVLLLGETGTGKELVAEAIHAASPRRERVMVRVNCAAIPVTLIESELFGRERGAYTGALSKQVGRFELATGSTIFLDEIGDLPLDIQGKLLRVLQERQIERLGSPRPIPVDLRIVAATNRDLDRDVRDGRFREDLYYRLAVFPVRVPPLRDRLDDLPLLVAALVDELAGPMGKRIERVSRQSLDALARYAWPGNVRELRNAVERALILATGPVLEIVVPGASGSGPEGPPETRTRSDHPDRAEYLRVLQQTGWRIRGTRGAAAVLGLKPTTLETRMARLGITRP